MPEQQNFFYSNLFIAIVTFIVGTFGLYLYHRRKNDNKKRIAKTILTEIQAAETELSDVEKRVDANNPLPEHMRIMPSDSWTTNRHLFASDFNSNEIGALNRFYAQCEIVARLLGIMIRVLLKTRKKLEKMCIKLHTSMQGSLVWIW